MKKILFLLIICLVTFATCFSPMTQAKDSTNTKMLTKKDVKKLIPIT